MKPNMRHWNLPIERFTRDDAGTGTVFSIFAIAMLLIIGGVAVDGSNFWRHQQLLQQTADVAAHAGVVQLAYGNGSDAAEDATSTFVNTNMPASHFGNLYHNQSSDIEVVHYDEATNTISDAGKPNAVRVYLHRNELSDNPVQTLTLRVADIFLINEQTNLSTWNLQVRGVAALAKFQGCNSTDGIYAEGQLRLSSSNTIGGGYCLHSQDAVWMSQQNTFMPTSGVSMPNLDSCGSKCTDSANPGSTAASFERNLIMPDITAHIQGAYDSFLASGDTTMRDNFFSDKYLESGALQALEDVGIKTGNLTRGSVVTMTDAKFEELTDVPEGLIYNVTCKSNGNPDSVRIEFGAEKNSPGKNGGKYFTPSEFSDVAIVTNCGFEFLSSTNITSSVLISTRQVNTHSITANSGASVGDSLGGCSVDDQTVIMGMSSMSVPADFAGSNVSFIIDDDIHLSASSSSSTLDHSGVSFHSSGEIDIAANHTFNSCANPPSGLVPLMQVIRHVIPGDA